MNSFVTPCAFRRFGDEPPAVERGALLGLGGHGRPRGYPIGYKPEPMAAALDGDFGGTFPLRGPLLRRSETSGSTTWTRARATRRRC